MPTWSTTPENSRPRILETPGGTGYLPSRWRVSARLMPKARTRTRHSVGLGVGLATLGLMCSAVAGPVELWMSVAAVSVFAGRSCG